MPIPFWRVIPFILSGLLSGCGAAHKVEQNVAISMDNVKTYESSKTGRATIYVGPEQKSSFEFYSNDNELFVLVNSKEGYSFDGYHLISVKRDLWENCHFKDSGEAGCLDYMAKKFNVKKVQVNNPKMVFYPATATGNNLYVNFTSRFDRSTQKVTVEYIDNSSKMMEWVGKYPSIKQSSALDYINYAKEYPDTPHANSVMTDMFEKFFSVSVIGKADSAQRQTQQKGLASSSTGGCKDITRKIRITPKDVKGAMADITVDAKYTLRRTYEPYQIAEKDDPLYSKKTYQLNAGNKFTATDDVTFPCVLTSGRYHFATLSFLGKILGKEEQNSGVNITLKNVGFDIDITRVQ